MKTSSLTNRPDLFLRHMQDDELVLEGFKGRKGLLEAGGAEPPRMSLATLTKYANDWIDAMGGGGNSMILRTADVRPRGSFWNSNRTSFRNH
ncbi:MAG: hypothetical protein E8D52_07530 [Nitrospira sp.]|nr:MAG: hypothetical protein E8D52_07530 [Nitrospira sp.]